MRSFILFFLTGCICAAQSITIGAIGGARPTDLVPNPAIDESKRYEVGPMIGVGLPFGLAIEVDALYSRDGFSAANSSALSSISLGARTNTWQVPLLLKYRLPFPIVKPFVEAGYAARVMTGSLHVDSFFLANPNGQFQFAASSENFDSVSHGFVAGGGVPDWCREAPAHAAGTVHALEQRTHRIQFSRRTIVRTESESGRSPSGNRLEGSLEVTQGTH